MMFAQLANLLTGILTVAFYVICAFGTVCAIRMVTYLIGDRKRRGGPVPDVVFQEFREPGYDTQWAERETERAVEGFQGLYRDRVAAQRRRLPS